MTGQYLLEVPESLAQGSDCLHSVDFKNLQLFNPRPQFFS
jgi:hypothetical protein